VTHTYLFLDTEWADLEGNALVSLALIGADDKIRFYVERDPLPLEPTEFVREHVYPLLERGPVAMADVALVHALRSFLASVPNPLVLFDYANDLALLRRTVAGLGLLPSELSECAAPPRSLEALLVQDPAVAVLLEDHFAAHPDDAKRRHHALVDANAFRIACLRARSALDTPASFSIL